MSLPLLDCALADLDREEVRRFGFHRFVQLGWPEVDPAPFVDSWHIEQIALHLEAVSRGELRKLLINVPPGMSKSRITSVMWPAWDWIAHPARKWIVATVDPRLAARDALDCRRLLNSPWYQERWGDVVQIDNSEDVQTTQGVYSTTAKGRRVSTSVRSSIIGWHGDIQLVDDPNKPEEMRDPELAQAALERTWSWWKGTLASRRIDPKRLAQVVIMQRLSDSDLVGRILEDDTDHEWTHLMLPMRFEPERACKTQWGGDVRSEPGELLCPARFDEAAVKADEKRMGSQVAAAQLQQRPAPLGGNIFHREWFTERWSELPGNLSLAMSVDCSFKDSVGSDYVAIQMWGWAGDKFYLVDRIHDRMGLPATCACIRTLKKRWPSCRVILIEDKANGPAVEQVLRDELPGIVMLEPKTLGGSKVARANAVSPLAEARNVMFPARDAQHKTATGSVVTYEWVEEMIEEVVTFPFARHDDDVDAMDQALIYLHDHLQGRYMAAMRKIRSEILPFARGRR